MSTRRHPQNNKRPISDDTPTGGLGWIHIVCRMVRKLKAESLWWCLINISMERDCDRLLKIVTERSNSDPTIFTIIKSQEDVPAKHTSNVIAPQKIQMHSQQSIWLVFINIPTHWLRHTHTHTKATDGWLKLAWSLQDHNVQGYYFSLWPLALGVTDTDVLITHQRSAIIH